MIELKNEYPIATITMDNGDEILLELYPEMAPITVANFVDLAESFFYDGLQFHRVVKDFVLQGGSPNNTCDGELDFHIKGEFESNGFENPLKHTEGVISMARDADPDTAGTQFFIMHKPSERLDGNYAAFGKVIKGYEIVDKIAQTAVTGEEDTPVTKQVIKSIRIQNSGYVPDALERLYFNS